MVTRFPKFFKNIKMLILMKIYFFHLKIEDVANLLWLKLRKTVTDAALNNIIFPAYENTYFSSIKVDSSSVQHSIL